ncbi:hypothetical protein D3C74_304520 [compost metagenome]
MQVRIQVLHESGLGSNHAELVLGIVVLPLPQLTVIQVRQDIRTFRRTHPEEHAPLHDFRDGLRLLFRLVYLGERQQASYIIRAYELISMLLNRRQQEMRDFLRRH